MLNGYLLEQLIAVYECGTLSAAAEKLHLTQSTLSRSMQKLESLFQATLFDRQKNRITLNAAGRLAAESAKHIQAAEAEMIESVRALERQRPVIRLGCMSFGLMQVLSPQLQALYPGATVQAETHDEQALLDGFSGGAYQLIVLNHPLEPPGIICRPCGHEELYFAVVKGHRIARRKQCTFQEMDGENFLMAVQAGFWGDIVRRKMPASHFFVQNDVEGLHAVAQTSTMSRFATNCTQHTYQKEDWEVYIPIADAEAKQPFFCCCYEEAADAFAAWLQFLAQRYGRPCDREMKKAASHE